MPAKSINVVFWWKGGTEAGKWCPSFPEARSVGNPTKAEVDAHVAKLNRAGFVAHRGSTTIGAPEGPPSFNDFRDVRQASWSRRVQAKS